MRVQMAMKTGVHFRLVKQALRRQQKLSLGDFSLATLRETGSVELEVREERMRID
jgi:hypothetical protein